MQGVTGPRLTKRFKYDIVTTGEEYLSPGGGRRFAHGGVYTIWIRDTCHYVGMSLTNMRARLSHHLRNLHPFPVTPPKRITIKAVFADEPTMDELLFIYALRPRLNAQSKHLHRKGKRNHAHSQTHEGGRW